ncbi:MAG: FMN-dependent NADH-azoreductase [Firmicutes bacterium ADurb.Bin456]|nr:MAG: FMN-dependent NADH-azoreductase [Firmicutes bacterium ADurb.Bin456]
MARILAVLANPRVESYTRKLLHSFLEAYKNCHPNDEIEELDLYRIKIPVIDNGVLTAWSKTEEQLTAAEKSVLAKIYRFTDQFVSASKVVFAAPMWNLHFPPALLAYVANIAVAGKTFKYTMDGCQGLVDDKPALLIHVRGGVYSQGPMQAMDHAVPYLKSLCSLLGINNFQTIICEGIEMYPHRSGEILAAAMAETEKLARHF